MSPGASSYSGSYAINGLVAPDQYTVASTIEGVPISWVVIDVSNQIIFWQLKIQIPGYGGAGNWEGAEKQMIPGSKQIVRPNIVGIRFRAATPLAQIPAGSFQAIVTVEAVT